MKTVCAWCFPGLVNIDGDFHISHGCCQSHLELFCFQMDLMKLADQLRFDLIEYEHKEKSLLRDTVAA